jgi:hypothetical protein
MIDHITLRVRDHAKSKYDQVHIAFRAPNRKSVDLDGHNIEAVCHDPA